MKQREGNITAPGIVLIYCALVYTVVMLAYKGQHGDFPRHELCFDPEFEKEVGKPATEIIYEELKINFQYGEKKDRKILALINIGVSILFISVYEVSTLYVYKWIRIVLGVIVFLFLCYFFFVVYFDNEDNSVGYRERTCFDTLWSYVYKENKTAKDRGRINLCTELYGDCVEYEKQIRRIYIPAVMMLTGMFLIAFKQ